MPNVIQLSIIQCGRYQLTCCVTLLEQKFHQTGIKGKWYYQSIRHKTEIGKVEKFSVWNGKFRKEYSEFFFLFSGIQISTSNPSYIDYISSFQLAIYSSKSKNTK